MLEDYDGLALADLIRRREITSSEVVEDVIERINRLDPRLNMLTFPMFDLARREARQASRGGPFGGVPFLVKDLEVSIPGVRMSNGSRAQKNYEPSQECQEARSIREAGFVVLGKTNTPELGLAYLTNPAAFGPTRNPWDLTRNAGGSSGGSSAAVAARVVPLASSSDGGGSIRIPASYCGVFGFKPSRGLNSRFKNDVWGGATVSHVTTLTVRDSAAYLDWTSAGTVSRDLSAPRAGSYLAASMSSPHQLRIGMMTSSPLDSDVHPDCVAAVQRSALLLTNLGHRVEACELPYPGREMLHAFLSVVFSFTAKDVQDMSLRLRTNPAHLDIEPQTRFIAEMGRGISDRHLAEAFSVWKKCAELMSLFHKRFDVLVTPVTATPPPRHNACGVTSLDQLLMGLAARLRLGRFLFGKHLVDEVIVSKLAAAPFTQIANVTGQPAMSVPLHWSPHGLPIGVQFVAPINQDGLLFSLAQQLEEAAPWKTKQPPYLSVLAAKQSMRIV